MRWINKQKRHSLRAIPLLILCYKIMNDGLITALNKNTAGLEKLAA